MDHLILLVLSFPIAAGLQIGFSHNTQPHLMKEWKKYSKLYHEK